MLRIFLDFPWLSNKEHGCHRSKSIHGRTKTSFKGLKLPLLRWKRFPYTAVLYAHVQNAIREGVIYLSMRHIFSIAMLLVFSVVLILFKDIPDIKGDEMHGIKLLASQIGPELMFWSCIWLRGIAYGVVIIIGATSSSICSKYVTILGHMVTIVALSVRAKSVDTKSMASISSMYLLLWKVLFRISLLWTHVIRHHFCIPEIATVKGELCKKVSKTINANRGTVEGCSQWSLRVATYVEGNTCVFATSNVLESRICLNEN